MSNDIESITIDPNSKADMAAVKRELTQENKSHKNSLRFELMKVTFDKPLKDCQADAIIKLLGDITKYKFDVMDIMVHVANLVVLFRVKAHFKATCRLTKPKLTYVYMKTARILNSAIKKGEITPWDTPADYPSSYEEQTEMEEKDHEASEDDTET